MGNSVKNTLIALLVAVMLAPGFYLGVAPISEVQAQTEGLGMEDYMGSILSAGIAVSACMFGSVIAGLIDRGISALLSRLADLFKGSVFAGIFQFLGILAAQTVLVPIYISDTNFQLQGAADATMSLEFKDCVLDGIIWIAKRILIDVITAEISNWIGVGFLGATTDGYPLFIQNPGDWARDLAYSTSDLFLDVMVDDDSLCEPFREDVVDIAADIANKPTIGPDGRATCDMEAIGGVDGFESMVEEGALTDRGILAAMALGEEGNNAMSSYFNLQADTSARVNKVVASEMTLGEWGDGYHSMRCGTDVDQVCTPGQFIAKQIDDWMGGALGQLEVADEISEIVDALFAHLTENIFFDFEEGLLRDAPEPNDHGTAEAYEGSGSTEGYTDPYDIDNGYDGYDEETGTYNPGEVTVPEPGSFDMTIVGVWDSCPECGFVFDSAELVITTSAGTQTILLAYGRLIAKDDGRSFSFSANLDSYPEIITATLVLTLNRDEGMAMADTGSILGVEPLGIEVVPLELGNHKYSDRTVEIDVTDYARSSQNSDSGTTGAASYVNTGSDGDGGMGDGSNWTTGPTNPDFGSEDWSGQPDPGTTGSSGIFGDPSNLPDSGSNDAPSPLDSPSYPGEGPISSPQPGPADTSAVDSIDDR